MEKIDSILERDLTGTLTAVSGGGGPGTAAVEQLDGAIEILNAGLAEIETRCAQPDANTSSLLGELTETIHAAEEVCREVDDALRDDPEALKQARIRFRERTNHYFSKSYFMNRARVWPQGYPGDYRIIENAYRNTPLSEGIGLLLDSYFLSATLAVAIRERRATMRSILAEELRSRNNPNVLNIGCGPCREVLELASPIKQSGAQLTCIDFDSDALNYSAERLSFTDVGDQVDFRRYNALRMINARRNAQVFGHQDIIYTIGLLDYLTDDTLERLLRAMYDLLKPGGTFVAVFKDCERYATQDYHWLVDWDGFFQRTSRESRALVETAGIPNHAVSVERDGSGVIVFYRIRKAG